MKCNVQTTMKGLYHLTIEVEKYDCELNIMVARKRIKGRWNVCQNHYDVKNLDDDTNNNEQNNVW